MAISQPHVRILSRTALATTAEQTSSAFVLHPGATQWTILANWTTAGTLDIDVQGMDGSWYEIDSDAIVANTPYIQTYTSNPGQGAIRARFTPGAQPTTGFVDASYSGHGGNTA